MRLWGFFTVIPLLVGMARSRFLDRQQLEPATIEQQTDQILDAKPAQPGSEASASQDVNLQLRDVTSSLDYRCGSKWGTCPSGTCCSSAGRS